jgi:hypothetical protein
MSKIRADLITQVHAMEKNLGNNMTVIREALETQMCGFVGQAELEERLDKQQKNVASISEPQTCGRNWRALGENSRPN